MISKTWRYDQLNIIKVIRTMNSLYNGHDGCYFLNLDFLTVSLGIKLPGIEISDHIAE